MTMSDMRLLEWFEDAIQVEGPGTRKTIYQEVVDRLKPRVYTLDDLEDAETCWLEYRTERPGWGMFEPAVCLIQDIDDYLTLVNWAGNTLCLDLEDMGRAWRVWNRYPNHKQLTEEEWK